MSEPATTTFSELLRTFRTRVGLTQAALAEQAGLSDQAISVLERGTRSRPRMDTVRSLTTALDLSPAEADLFLTVARGKSSRSAPNRTAGPADASDASAAPWQLPPAARDFTGRAAQLDAILSVLRNPRGIGPVGLVAITGMGGIGKTTLAVQAAHLLTDSYPDGHLYLNLRGYGPGEPMSVADAQRHLLRSLGHDIRLLPEDVEEAAALLRSKLAKRRILVLLDNAAHTSYVPPLLPGSSGSAAIITSRGSLVNLAGARQIHLDVLSDAESIDLLSGLIGESRVAAEPEAAKALAMYSGRLPLAVRLIGGRLATRPTWPIHHLVDILQDEERRLDSLGTDETSVRASIASSVRFLESSDRELDRQAARSLPMLSVPDGADLLTVVASRLLDLPVRRTRLLLERLVDLSLLESVAPERYRFHDLIRAYARELAEQQLDSTEQTSSLARVLNLYIAVGWACQALTHPASPRLPLATVRDSDVPVFRDRQAAQHWLDEEQRNLMDRFRQAKRSPLAGTAAFPELALALFGYHESRRRWPEMVEIGEGAVETALAHRLPVAAAWLQHDAAIPEAENGDAATAVDWIITALKMFRELGDRSGQARCCSSLAYLLGVVDRVDEALEYGEEALALSRSLENQTLEGVSLTAVGGLYDRRGDFERADQAFAAGIALALRSDDPRSTFKRYINAALSHLRVGRHQDALDMATKGLTTAGQLGDGLAQAESHHLIALTLAAEGKYDDARAAIVTGMLFAARSRDIIREGRLYLDLARIDAARGDRSQALDDLRNAITKLHGASAIHEADALELLTQLRRGKTYTFALRVHFL